MSNSHRQLTVYQIVKVLREWRWEVIILILPCVGSNCSLQLKSIYKTIHKGMKTNWYLYKCLRFLIS